MRRSASWSVWKQTYTTMCAMQQRFIVRYVEIRLWRVLIKPASVLSQEMSDFASVTSFHKHIPGLACIELQVGVTV